MIAKYELHYQKMIQILSKDHRFQIPSLYYTPLFFSFIRRNGNISLILFANSENGTYGVFNLIDNIKKYPC